VQAIISGWGRGKRFEGDKIERDTIILIKEVGKNPCLELAKKKDKKGEVVIDRKPGEEKALRPLIPEFGKTQEG